jgi:hypothetical protein
MTPKEKASLLVLKYMSKVVSINLAKECALIALEELLNEYPQNCPGFSHEMERHLFFMQVKQEIEKI